MDDRFLARFTAICRVGIGAGFLLNPSLSMRVWVGRDSTRPSARVLARALGVRDLVLAVGTLTALRDGGSSQPWLRAALLADATDLAATVTERDELPPGGRDLVAGIAAVATAIGAKLVFFPRRV
jgi:hypothetical protein